MRSIEKTLNTMTWKHNVEVGPHRWIVLPRLRTPEMAWIDTDRLIKEWHKGNRRLAILRLTITQTLS